MFSLIFSSEAVKIEGAFLLVSQVSGAARPTATDPPEVCEEEEEKRDRKRKQNSDDKNRKKRG